MRYTWTRFLLCESPLPLTRTWQQDKNCGKHCGSFAELRSLKKVTLESWVGWSYFDVGDYNEEAPKGRRRWGNHLPIVEASSTKMTSLTSSSFERSKMEWTERRRTLQASLWKQIMIEAGSWWWLYLKSRHLRGMRASAISSVTFYQSMWLFARPMVRSLKVSRVVQFWSMNLSLQSNRSVNI